jgi:YidC/Oxa1 family membrane protein insertase
MDKTGIIVVSLCVALLGVWLYQQNEYSKQLTHWQQTNQVAQLQAQLTNSPSTSTTTAAGASVAAATATAPVIFASNLPEQTLVLTNGRARYTFTTRGGGLKSVEFFDYPQTISARWKNDIHTAPGLATLNNKASVPALAVLGDASFVGDGQFTLTTTGNGGVRAEKILADGLVIAKEFHFSSNYLLNATVTLKNTSDKSLLVPPQEIVVGTATPMDADDSGQLWGAMWCDGTNATDNPIPAFSGGGFSCSKGPAKTEIRAGSGHVVWASAHNQFFALVAMPKLAATEMVARPVTLPRFQDSGAATNAAPPQGVQTALVYPAQTLTANASIERQIELFAGPKEFRTLARIAEERKNAADQVMNFGTGFASFWGVGTFFAKLLLSGMNALHDLTKLGYGWTIVLITILIKLLFWPLTAKSTRSMKKMQALAPELKALQEKYKDDVQKLTSKQWELYKKHKVSPMSGCLPMLVQMPVFIGFFTMIRSAIELRGASFLWAADLSKPDTLFMIPGITFLPIISTPEGMPFNLLPILMGASMLWQSHLTPASPGMDPAQQKMMRWLPAIFILFLYNYSSGLALYWTVNNLLTVLQTKLTKSNEPVVTVAPATPALTAAPKKKK